MSDPRLRLFAQDAEDLRALSAHLQDSVLKVGDMAYTPEHMQFAFVANRYRWEARAGEQPQRVRSGVHFSYVQRVEKTRIRMDAKDAVLSLLSIDAAPAEGGEAVVTFQFSGGGAIRLTVECVDAVLEDLSSPWSAVGEPSHEA